MSNRRENHRTAAIRRTGGRRGPRTCRAPLAAALILALALDANAGHAHEVAIGLRPEALAYFAGEPLPADMSWEHKVHLDALARHYGLPSPVPAEGRAVIPVTNCNDSGAGSLRNAIAVAASGDTINAAGLTCSTISLSTGALVINQASLDIRGPGRGDLTIRPGAKYGRVIRHQGSGTLTLSGMTLREGRVSPSATESGTAGGCIFSNGTVTLGNSGDPDNTALGVHVRDCAAIGSGADDNPRGGGVYTRGGLNMYASVISGCTVQANSPATQGGGGGAFAGANGSAGAAINMKYSEVRDNTATGTNARGGGIRNGSGIRATNILNSTIARNQATSMGGGLYLAGRGPDEIVISNSTISGNTAATSAGAQLNLATQAGTRGDITVVASTITRNRASSPGAVAGLGVLSHLELQSALVADNISSNNLANDISHSDGDLTGADNLVGVGQAPSAGLIRTDDPRLAGLANNGGPTRTHAPLIDSPAIDRGNIAVNSDVDQRGPGFPRVRGVRADIGAFERDPDWLFVDGFE